MRILFCTAIAVALLSACGQRSTDSADAAPADVAATEAAAQAKATRQDAAAEVAVEQRMAQYRARLIPLIAAAYSGQCTQGAAAAKDAITVGADGVIRARQWKHDLKTSNGKFGISRTLDAGKPVAAYVAADNRDPEWNLIIMTGKEESVTFGEGASAIKCEAVAEAAQLRTRHLYAAVASFFTAGASTLGCGGAGAPGRNSTTVKAGADGVAIGDRSFSFERGIREETVGIDDSGKVLSYGVEYADDSKLVLSLDLGGKISDVIFTGKDDLICTAL